MRKLKPDSQKETVRISKLCVNKGCVRRGTVAKRLSDFWIVLCDQCQGKTIALDMNKICAEELRGTKRY
jgi:hypothetical protein